MTEEQMAFFGSTGILRITGALLLAFLGKEGDTRRENGLLWTVKGDPFVMAMAGELIT